MLIAKENPYSDEAVNKSKKPVVAQVKNVVSKKAAKTSKSASKKTDAPEVYQALDAVEIISIPLSELVPSELNVRKRPDDETKLTELANSIQAVGVLQNLVVHVLGNGKYGVAAGQRRLQALNTLLQKELIDQSYTVPAKVVSEEDALIISLTENSQREAMHPADQLIAFGELNRKGYKEAAIADLLGYTTRHVKKCLRLAQMAPALLEELANDNITLEQLQALSVSNDHERQIDVWNNSSSWEKEPYRLRQIITQDKSPVAGNALFELVGQKEYEQSGGTLEIDLFTDAGFIENLPLLEKLANEKLNYIATEIARIEGWNWSQARISPLRVYSDDAGKYVHSEPENGEIVESLKVAYDEAKELAEEADRLANSEEEESKRNELYRLSRERDDQLEHIVNQSEILAWTPEEKAGKGVFVSINGGCIEVDRGVVALSTTEKEKIADTDQDIEPENKAVGEASAEQSQNKGYSAALTKSLSSERTLAVQAALTQHSHVALVLLVHDAVKKNFASSASNYIKHLNIIFELSRVTLLDNAPTARESKALSLLREQHEHWISQFPENWKNSGNWLLEWPQEKLISLLAYCTANTVSGAQYVTCSHNKIGSSLEPIEALIEFDLSQWWQPTQANFFGRISKDQIIDCLIDGGFTGAAIDAGKMKKGDAAELAEDLFKNKHWLPDCFKTDINTENSAAE
ncbi:ParB/RepB/Spo0J family partition protein [Xenorhabdus sp. SGI246]|uniref:ParB/RepB/Spo0J family partition protein n=1 Tax=Xenorhabdus sp. SGI246 TaxID=3158263 RepID=UPI00349F297F